MSHGQAKQLFVRERDFDIGRSIKEVPLPSPTEIMPVNEQTSLYIYEFKNTGCRWSYTVDNETKKVRSWQFVSDPDLCYMRVSYGGG